MTNANQVLLISVVTVMTVLLTVIGVQLFLVLRDLRRLLSKTNKVVDELEKVGMSVGHGYSEILGFVAALKKVFFVVDLLAQKKKKKHAKK